MIDLLAVVALTEDIPDESVRRGQVGTVVELLAPDVYLVEFSNKEGVAYAMPALNGNQLLVLHFEQEPITE